MSMNHDTNDLFSLQDKFILVTGGTRGIGRAVSLRFSRAGASVIANYVHNDDAAEELKSIADKEKISIDICRADLTSKKGLDFLITTIEKYGKKIDSLVHCAATGVHRGIEELTARHFDWVFSLNIRSFFEVVKLLIPFFTNKASILAISSQGAVRAVQSYSLIGASKGALESFSRHMAVELISKGIRINILSPGTVLTDSWKAMPDKEKRIKKAISRTPLGRLVTPDEVAYSAQFLCSDASAGIVGHTLVVDGGARVME